MRQHKGQHSGEQHQSNFNVCELCMKYGSKRTLSFTSLYLSNEVSVLVTPCELQKHQTEQSLWIRSGDKVYDVTEYIASHPGGKRCFLKRSFKNSDCSDDYKFHSTKARRIWDSLKVYKLVPCEGEKSPNEDMCVIS